MDEAFNELFSVHNLCEAFYACIKANKWKSSTQIYWANMLSNIVELHDDLLSGSYKLGRTIDFTINERGHLRHIESPQMRDRIVQKVLCTKVLIPQITPFLIYDNYASLANRGTSMARRRTEISLRDWYTENGDEGYVVQMDIKNYFGSISHEILKDMLRDKLNVSCMTMSLIEYIIDNMSDSDVGLNLGSEMPQICSVFFPHGFDNWFKIVKRVKAYGRYMDDVFFIVKDKKEAVILLEDGRRILSQLGLRVNEKKTKIVKISHGFTFLQTKYNIDKGRVVTRPTREKLTRERRRLTRLKGLVIKGRITEVEVGLWYYAWRENLKKDYNSCYRSLRSMDEYFWSLFPSVEIKKKLTRSEMIDKAFKEMSYEDSRCFRQCVDRAT